MGYYGSVAIVEKKDCGMKTGHILAQSNAKNVGRRIYYMWFAQMNVRKTLTCRSSGAHTVGLAASRVQHTFVNTAGIHL